MILVETVTAPAHWCGYLVNGDESELTEAELDKADLFRKALAPARIVDVERDDDGEPVSPFFTWRYRLYGGETPGGEVLDYVTHSPCP